MAKKRVLLLLRRTPLNSEMASEGLRQAVGLTLADNQVSVLLLDAAAWLAMPLSPEVVQGGEIRKHIEFLLLLEGEVKVEEESLARYGIDREKLLPGIQVINSKVVAAEIASAEATISF